MKKSLLYTAFSILILLGVFHFLGRTFYLYWDMRWFDSLMHFLGGISMSFICLWVWYASGFFGKEIPNKKQAFLAALVGGLAIGIGWELFEFSYGIAHPIGSYAYDTFHDVLADFIGSATAGIIGARTSYYE